MIAEQGFTSYKPTGIPWLPEVPEHWKLRRNKYLLREIDERSEKGEEDLLSVSQYTGVTRRKDKVESEDELITNAATLEGYRKVAKEDLVVNIMLAWNGSLGVSPYHGITSPAYSVYRFKSDAHPGYFHYLFRTKAMQAYFRSVSTGVIDSRLRMYSDDFFRLYSFVPPLNEQQAIAEYLDEKTAQIARFFQKKAELISLLREQKSAIIQQALTPEFWKDEVPESEWVRKKLKYVVKKVGAGVTPKGGATTYLSAGIPLLRSQNVHNHALLLDEVAYISQGTHDEMAGSKVQAGDVLLNITGGSLGRCFYADEHLGEANVNQHVSIIRPNQREVSPQFLHLLLLSDYGQQQIWKEQTGSGREGLTAAAIKNFTFDIPSKRMQQQIISYIRAEHQKIDAIITRTEKEIVLVKELQQSIIAEAVTGKIKIN